MDCALVSTILFLQQFPHGIIFYYKRKKLEYSRSCCRTTRIIDGYRTRRENKNGN